MSKLSVIIPSRNEKYTVATVEDVFRNAGGDVECVVVLEGWWPENWKAITDKYVNLHTIYHSEPQGMRPAINAAAASAISRGAKYLMKLDAHCALGEGFDEILKADCDKDWVVVPRRKRLDPETWTLKDVGKPDIDYHYLSFPDDPNDFGGPGLNGKVWLERAKERFGKPEYDIDDEMSSQGSGYFLHADYFQFLELLDEDNYGKFWNEAQEWGLKCWLSGGRVVVNKKTWYAHWHKGIAGRGYHLPESWLKQGATFTKKWLFNEAWPKQTLPFKSLIERFWPVPTWPENWEELVYGGKAVVVNDIGRYVDVDNSSSGNEYSMLKIHSAHYGINDTDFIHVTEALNNRIKDNSLDLVVTNSELEVGNPYRGKKKRLRVTYSYDGGEPVTVEREERDWLIIGQSAGYVKQTVSTTDKVDVTSNLVQDNFTEVVGNSPQLYNSTVASLTDLLIRRFSIPSHRLRGPMPIEVPTFHRDDLAKLFAELGFNRGAEIGVAEGNYSEVLVKANPNLELLCVDPWHAYSGNPQNKSKEKNEYAYNEAKRKLEGSNARLIMKSSIDAARDVDDGSLDFVYVDGNHSFDFVLLDLILWGRKVGSGGLITGDDYYYLDPKRWGAGPVEAVQAYTSAHKINPWFICNADRSTDYFWVKP